MPEMKMAPPLPALCLAILAVNEHNCSVSWGTASEGVPGSAFAPGAHTAPPPAPFASFFAKAHPCAHRFTPAA